MYHMGIKSREKYILLVTMNRGEERALHEQAERRRISSSAPFEVEGELFRIVRDPETGTGMAGYDTWRLLRGVHENTCPCVGCRPSSVALDRACGVTPDDRPPGDPLIWWKRDRHVFMRPEKGGVEAAARRFFGTVPVDLHVS